MQHLAQVLAEPLQPELKSVSLYAGLSSDEFTLYSGVGNQKLIDYYKNSLKVNSNQSSGSEYWSELYNYIFICNAALEGLDNPHFLTSPVKQQLMGEARFFRSFLLLLFG